VPDEPVVLVYDRADFRVGGTDVSRCGPTHDMMFVAETLYLDIVPDRRIVSVETVSKHGTRLSVSLVTADIQPRGGGTRLVLTDQVVALDDPDILKGHEQGYSGARQSGRLARPPGGGVSRSAGRHLCSEPLTGLCVLSGRTSESVGVSPWRRVQPGGGI
jgi:hypothetical protein